MLAKWKVDGEPVHIQKTYREKLVNGRFQKVDTSYEDTFCEFATEKFADKSLYHKALRDVWDDDGTIYAVDVLFNVDMEFEFELADFEAFGAFLMPFKIKAKEVKEKESMAKRRSLTEVGPRKPRVTSDDLATSMPHSKIKVPSTSDTRLGVWRDAEDVASRVGYDKVWHTTVTGEGKWRDFDYGGMVTWYTQFPMFFYAFDKEDALDRLSAFKSRKFAG